MIKKILIPLDGSKLAESALAPARILCTELHAVPILIHIIEKNAPHEVHGERHLFDVEQARAYLEALVKKNPFLKKAKAEIHVHEDEVSHLAQSIVEHGTDYETDLTILTRHGEGGWKDRVVGSLARQVIAQSHKPVLLLNTKPESGAVCDFRHILLPLDGNPEHDLSEKISTDFATQLRSSLLLLNVVPTYGTLPAEQSLSGRLLPSATDAMLDISEESAVQYIQSHITRLSKTGLAVKGEVQRGDPVECIFKVALDHHVDLIALATHGKAGLEAFGAGSVAPRVISESTIPLLLIPV